LRELENGFGAGKLRFFGKLANLAASWRAPPPRLDGKSPGARPCSIIRTSIASFPAADLLDMAPEQRCPARRDGAHDASLARLLNRIGVATGHGNAWTQERVRGFRHHHEIAGHRDGEWAERGEITGATRIAYNSCLIGKFRNGELTVPPPKSMRVSASFAHHYGASVAEG
jgi:hypothetical protein